MEQEQNNTFEEEQKNDIEQKQNNNKNIIYLVIFSMIIGLGVLIIKSSFDYYESGVINTQRDNNKTNIKENEVKEKTKNDSQKVNETKGKDFPFDTSAYKLDSRLEPYSFDMAYHVFSKNYDINILDNSKYRITILNNMLIKNNVTQFTTGTGQNSFYISKDLYAQKFYDIYGPNYDYDNTANEVEKGSWFNYCESYPEGIGDNVCIDTIVSAIGEPYFVNISEQVINNEKVVTGDYYSKASFEDTKYIRHGTFEIRYNYVATISYLKSIVLKNLEDYS